MWDSDPWELKKFGGNTIKGRFSSIYTPLSSSAFKKHEDCHKEIKVVCVHSSFDIVHRLGKGTDLRRYCNYIIGQFLLSCIEMQVLEASQTPLIAWNLRSPLHDKCIWTQSVCNGFFAPGEIQTTSKTVPNVHTQTFLCRGMRGILCVEVGEINTACENKLCSQSFSNVRWKLVSNRKTQYVANCRSVLGVSHCVAVDHTVRMSLNVY